MGKYDPWDAFFAELEGNEVRLSFAELEEMTGVQLPPSARKHSPWWSNVQHHARWRDHGWSAHADVAKNEVIFTRVRGSGDTTTQIPIVASEPVLPASVNDLVESSADLVLLGCVSQKAGVASPARDLYTSPLWQKRRAYAEATGKPWMILSAEHGLIDPGEHIEPYDRSLKDESSAYRSDWSERTAKAVADIARRDGLQTIEMHAGAAYLESGLVDRLESAGFTITRPLRGLKIGEQLSWYGHTTTGATPPPTREAKPSGRNVAEHRLSDAPPRPHIVDLLIGGVEAAAGWLTDRLERMRPSEQVSPVPEAAESPDEVIVTAMLTHGAVLDAEGVSRIVPLFTENEAANTFLVEDDWAFLVAVICDYQVRAERAWEAPYELSRRLGGWSVELVASNPEQVEAAFVQRPSLHRFPTQTAGWVVDAARRVLDEYGGQAGAIWGDRPTAAALQGRFSEFSGISQKKAAMAVEILHRHFDVEIRDLSGSDIAYDIHVRRVMLRTGLAQSDDVNHMVAAARRLYPQRPGALDLPMWDIGRTWCRPQNPQCSACALGDICPQLIDRAVDVSGA